MTIRWKTELPQWIILAAMFGMAAARWSSAPDRIPVHWNISGQVDRYGGRFEGLLLLPLVALALYLFMIVIPRIDPGKANYDAFSGPYAVIRISVLCVLAVLAFAAHKSFATRDLDRGRLTLILLGALWVVLGAVLGKIRPNWFVGIRTPWTLSSKQSWVRTHRAGGWVFVTVGLVSIITALFTAKLAFWVMVGGAVSGSLGLVVYSYLVFRDDPDKLPPAGTLPAD